MNWNLSCLVARRWPLFFCDVSFLLHDLKLTLQLANFLLRRPQATTSGKQDPANKGKYWRLYSGLFVLLKQKIALTRQGLEKLISAVQRAFACLVLGDVRCYV